MFVSVVNSSPPPAYRMWRPATATLPGHRRTASIPIASRKSVEHAGTSTSSTGTYESGSR
jgi:hypothetical protein